MADHQENAAERLVITASELGAAPMGGIAPAAAEQRSGIPWWGVVVGSVLTLSLPLLCGASIAVRVFLRHRERQRTTWTAFLCTLLIISGLITSVATAYVWFLKAPAVREAALLPLGLVSHDLASSFASFPATAPLSAVEIAAQTRRLVFIVLPEPGGPLRRLRWKIRPLGRRPC
ncbi:MAG: hypothetical protein IPP47_16235 [Bryobacterales bacterium]|nr:hypothetical protein [Bryobacterales bacterium]